MVYQTLHAGRRSGSGVWFVFDGSLSLSENYGHPHDIWQLILSCRQCYAEAFRWLYNGTKFVIVVCQTALCSSFSPLLHSPPLRFRLELMARLQLCVNIDTKEFIPIHDVLKMVDYGQHLLHLNIYIISDDCEGEQEHLYRTLLDFWHLVKIGNRVHIDASELLEGWKYQDKFDLLDAYRMMSLGLFSMPASRSVSLEGED